jgi:hypothetical protein
MNPEISEDTIRGISEILGATAKRETNHYRFEIAGNDPVRKLVLEVYPDIPIGGSSGTLVSVYTPCSNLQLQHCSGVVFSDMLGEVTFVAESGGKISGLIVEKEGACSLYANVDRSILSGDFTTLGPEIMMSSIALSLTELILPDEQGRMPAPDSSPE